MTVTLFTIPHAFDGDHDMVQRNALGSWNQIVPRPNGVLFCDDDGVADAAREFGFDHVPDVRRRDDIPLVSDAFRRVVEGDGRLFCYTNCDIILVDGLVDALDIAARHFLHFLMLGRRWNAEVGILSFDPGWQEDLSTHARENGVLDDISAIDWFAFSAGTIAALDMPDFLVGSPAWDNWLIARALEFGIPVVDATVDVFCVHQKHEKRWPIGGTAFNRRVAAGIKAFTNDASYRIERGSILPQNLGGERA
jgi:hypothetical protein